MEAYALLGGLGIGLVAGAVVGHVVTMRAFGLTTHADPPATETTVAPVKDFYLGDGETEIKVHGPNWSKNTTSDYTDSGPRVTW